MLQPNDEAAGLREFGQLCHGACAHPETVSMPFCLRVVPPNPSAPNRPMQVWNFKPQLRAFRFVGHKVCTSPEKLSSVTSVSARVSVTCTAAPPRADPPSSCPAQIPTCPCLMFTLSCTRCFHRRLCGRRLPCTFDTMKGRCDVCRRVSHREPHCVGIEGQDGPFVVADRQRRVLRHQGAHSGSPQCVLQWRWHQTVDGV